MKDEYQEPTVLLHKFLYLGSFWEHFCFRHFTLLFSENKKGNVAFDKGKAGNRRIVSGFESL